MAITIHWASGIIQVPRTDMLLVQSTPFEVRELDINDFRLELKELEAAASGMAFLRTHRHNTSVEIGGVILARVVHRSGIKNQ